MTCGRPVNAPPRHVFRADRTPASPRRASAPFAAACRRVLASEAWEVLERRRAAVVRVGEVPRSIRGVCVAERRLRPVAWRVFLHSFFLMFSIHFSLKSTARYVLSCECHTRATVLAAIDVHPIFFCTKLKRSCRRVVPVHRRRVVTGAPRAPNEAARLPPCDSSRVPQHICHHVSKRASSRPEIARRGS